MRHTLLALFSLALLSACDSTHSLKELRAATPVSDAYHVALAEQYRGFAEEKLMDYEWWTSKYFADKGLMAAYGRDTQPEDPAHWDIPTTQRAEFVSARAQLTALLRQKQTAEPALSGATLVAYDRWLESQHNQWNPAKIEEKRDAFFAHLEKLKAGAADPVASATPTPIESTSTILYFPLDSDRLSATAQAALAQLVADVKAAGNVQVSINGHADRAGSDQYNQQLSERRARYVLHALEAAGIPATILHYFAFGESDPKIATPDGIEEPQNRRVEIFLE